MIRGRKSKTHRCTPIRDAWLKSATYLGIPRKSIQRPWPGGPTRKGCRTILLLPGSAFQRLWQGGPPRKDTRSRLLLLGNAFQRLRPGASPRWGLPKKGSRTKSFFSEALARGSPGKAPAQACYSQEMPFRSFGRGVPPGKAPEQDSHYQEKL